MVSEFKERFSASSKIAMRMAKLLPSKCIDADASSAAADAFKEYRAFLDCPAVCKTEFERWQDFWRQLPPADRNIKLADALRMCDSDLYPNLHKLLKIFLTTPVTTCTAERSFSLLRLLKTHHRASMGQVRMNGLALLAVHQDIRLSYDSVVKEYARKYDPRLRLT